LKFFQKAFLRPFRAEEKLVCRSVLWLSPLYVYPIRLKIFDFLVCKTIDTFQLVDDLRQLGQFIYGIGYKLIRSRRSIVRCIEQYQNGINLCIADTLVVLGDSSEAMDKTYRLCISVQRRSLLVFGGVGLAQAGDSAVAVVDNGCGIDFLPKQFNFGNGLISFGVVGLACLYGSLQFEELEFGL